MINARLTHIRQTLSKRHHTRQAMMYNAVQERLNKSLNTYQKELDTGISYIETKNEIKVIKKL